MNRLVNLYNQKGAGPKNIALNFINEAIKSDATFLILIPNLPDYVECKNTDNVQFMRLSCPQNLALKSLFRLYLELFLIPYLIWRHKIKHMLAFGNFLFSPVKSSKTVLLHHPYLVDDELYNQLEPTAKFTEWLKRVAFYFTTKNVDHVVVQSEYMAQQLQLKYPKSSFQIETIPNPISHHFTKINDLDEVMKHRLAGLSNCLRIIYVSRYYPHKNHSFLLGLSKELDKLGIKHVFEVTINPEIADAKAFLDAIEDSDVSINNLTELPQAELTKHYLSAHAFIFPSKAETFGNPLIEAMCYGLPIIVPDLKYARSIAESAGMYFIPDDPIDGANILIANIFNEEAYKSYSEAALSRFELFKTSDKWFQQYLALISKNE